MRQIVPLILTMALAASPALATGEEEEGDGRSKIEEGMHLFFRGLKEEMSPALRDLQGVISEYGPKMLDFLEEMGPALGRVLDEVDDWSRYEAPEMLDNGDIIIRRKPDPSDDADPDSGPVPREEDPPPVTEPQDI